MILATGRADVLHGLLDGSALAGLTEMTSLPPMPVARVPRLVEGPAKVAGLAVEKGLAERIKDDMETPEALPLLAHMLALLYARCTDSKHLTLAAYLALGNAEQALNPVQNSVRLAAPESMAAPQDRAPWQPCGLRPSRHLEFHWELHPEDRPASRRAECDRHTSRRDGRLYLVSKPSGDAPEQWRCRSVRIDAVDRRLVQTGFADARPQVVGNSFRRDAAQARTCEPIQSTRRWLKVASA
jgi:hypothetical protein